MAIITVTVRLRRIEGRNPVDDFDLAAVVGEAVEAIGEVEVDDSVGESATYEITRVSLLIEQPDLKPGIVEATVFCLWCSKELVNDRPGRRRLYCGQPCKQAAYRERWHR
jgi:hypothetical protein